MAEFSGSIQITSGEWGKYSIILRCSEDSYSIENNTSRVYWWVGIRSNTQYHNHQGLSEHYKVVVNGSTVHDANHTVSCGSGQTVGIADGYTTVSHNADGSKSISASASFSCGDTSYYAPRTGSCSGTVKLTTIPRASSISIDSPSIECGNTININGSSASKNFTHKIYATWNGKTSELVTIASGTTTPSFSYTIPTAWEKDLPNSTSGIATFTLETFSGSTSVGSKSVNATIKVRSGVVPSIDSIKIADANSVCAGIGQIVQSQSRLNFTITYSGAQGSTVTSVSTKFEGQTYNNSSFTTGTVQGSGSITYTTTIYDSRGRSSQISGKVTVSAYSSPSLTNVTAKRANSSYAVDEASGTYALLHFKVGFTSLTGKNVTSFYIQYRASGASSWTKINSWDNNYTLEQDYKAGNLFTSATNSYEVAFGVKDKFMNDYSWQIFTVAPTYSLINFGKDGRSLTFFGQDGNQKDTLTVLGDIVAPMFLNKIFPVGAVYITYDKKNPGTFLGGTWEQFGQGRTLVGEGTGNDGSTSMSFTANQVGGEYKHLLSLNEMPSHAHKPHEWNIITAQGGNTGFYNMTYLGDNNRTGVFNPFIHDYDKNRYGSYVGNDIPHNNIQPYLVVFFWRRVK
nr:MAG TPA: Baseplate structural protein [Caudoviricetes sp.]